MSEEREKEVPQDPPLTLDLTACARVLEEQQRVRDPPRHLPRDAGEPESRGGAVVKANGRRRWRKCPGCLRCRSCVGCEVLTFEGDTCEDCGRETPMATESCDGSGVLPAKRCAAQSGSAQRGETNYNAGGAPCT